MKSINFKRQESAIRVGNQEATKKGPPINWDRMIYFLILGAILFFLVRWLFLNFWYIEANGEIIIESRKIQNVDDSRIIEFFVEEGDQVAAGQPLLILEAMKMENLIKSSSDGVIKKVSVSKGDSVEKNATLIEFE